MLDITISGSRNGHTPFFLWYTIKRFGAGGLKKRYQDCVAVAKYTLESLQKIGIAAWSNPNAITVVIPEPDQAVIYKWQLATDNGQSHIICMPGITIQEIDKFLDDINPTRSNTNY